MIWTAAKAALGPYAALAAALAIAGALGGVWWHGYTAGHGKAEAACEARIGDAERKAMQESMQAVREQRARADALEVANDTLRGIADDLLAQDRIACPLDDATRRGLQSIRPSYPNPADTAP